MESGNGSLLNLDLGRKKETNMKKFIFSSKTLLLAMCIVLFFLDGFVLGLRLGYLEGSQNTTEIRNQMLDIKPYDASLPVRDLEYSEILPSGVTITFNTDTKVKISGETEFQDLYCEWTVYPSDIFTITKVWNVLLTPSLYRAVIETYPEGGTVMFRILEGDLENNRGSLWFYINLPCSENPSTIFPPPYMPSLEN